ncbi:unnamed protein product [Cuscuta epithymum]|uniref:At1g61320/AtMIF1 LRR domain-containing protein n=1 Tax=Cuscuta epithymum TaxID=186058 RepID=A0AAV0C4N3_9ASTE|nr:unnamed protein product [Cuscuta epithymum]
MIFCAPSSHDWIPKMRLGLAYCVVDGETSIFFCQIILLAPHALWRSLSFSGVGALPSTRIFFLTSMDRFIQIHRGGGSEKIKTFSMSFCVERESTCRIERWVRHIAGLGVEELTLKLDNQFFADPISFPIRELLCGAAAPMLTSLYLSRCNLEPLNPQQPFKTLKSLTLHRIGSVDVKSILSSCPKLKSLCLDDCSLPSKVFIGGRKQLELKSLTFIACYGANEEIYLCAENLLNLEVSCLPLKFSHPAHAPSSSMSASREYTMVIYHTPLAG